MQQHGRGNDDIDGNEEPWDHSLNSHPGYTPLSRTLSHPSRSSQTRSDPLLSASSSYSNTTSQNPYESTHFNPHPNQGVNQPGNNMHFSSSPLEQARFWPHPSYGSGIHPHAYDNVHHADITANHDMYTYGPTFPSPLLNAHESTSQDERMTGDELTESRRPTVTQEEINKAIAIRNSSTPFDLPSDPTRYRIEETLSNPFPGNYARQNRRGDEQRQNDRNVRLSHGPYSRNSGRGFHKTTSMEHAVDPFQSGNAYSGRGQGDSFGSGIAGGIAIPQAPPMDHIRQSNLASGSFFPPMDSSPRSRSQAARSPGYDWSSERSGSSAATPAPTEGSADPAQSDQDESESRAYISTSPTASTSTSSSSTASRWARFRVPEDIYINPSDPVRHELYHQIRHEDWFIHQDQERPITGGEASRIHGSIPGESVLLAFYDRVSDTQGKPVMRCTICMRTNPEATLYPRPDRAKVHMRHHLELRPIPCSGKCDVPHCMQRFFTMGDLSAHVTGKTEPLATCEYCRKTMRAKNLKRHVTHFCHRAPPELRRNRG